MLALGLSLGLAAVLGSATACTPVSSERDDVDPLLRGDGGAGTYEFDPATLPRPRPVRSPESERPEQCDHVWEAMREGTHGYVDPLTGMPTLCTPLRCNRCGAVVHECQRRRR